MSLCLLLRVQHYVLRASVRADGQAPVGGRAGGRFAGACATASCTLPGASGGMGWKLCLICIRVAFWSQRDGNTREGGEEEGCFQEYSLSNLWCTRARAWANLLGKIKPIKLDCLVDRRAGKQLDHGSATAPLALRFLARCQAAGTSPVCCWFCFFYFCFHSYFFFFFLTFFLLLFSSSLLLFAVCGRVSFAIAGHSPKVMM